MNTEICIQHSIFDSLQLETTQFSVQLIGELTLQSAKQISEQLLSLDKQNLDFIPFTIQSSGGDVDALILIAHTMERCCTPIYTINLGHAFSAAAVIFCLGVERIAMPNSYFMFHETSIGIGGGKLCELQAVQKHYDRIDRMLNKKIEKNCNLEDHFFENKGSVDLYVSSKEALKFGLATAIGYPTHQINLSVTSHFKVSKGTMKDKDSKNPYSYQKYVTKYTIPEFTEGEEE